MAQNKTGQYFKYAIGEVFLIMIGILLALQINNWNEGRKQRIQEIDHLIGIKEDMSKDVITLNDRINALKNKVAVYKKINPSFDYSFRISDTLNVDHIDLKTIRLQDVLNRGLTHRLFKGAYQTYTSNASSGPIRNKNLLLKIQEIYENRDTSTFSVYQTMKEREQYLGWKYAYALSYRSINELFIDNPDKLEVFADFNFYYDHLALFYNHLRNVQNILKEVIDEIDVELRRLNE